MSVILIKLVNMSITASWLIVAVILLRALLKKAPRGMMCILWALVGIRLICPFSLESAVSLIPSAQTIPEDFATSELPVIDSGIAVVDRVTNTVIAENIGSLAETQVRPMELLMEIVSAIWIVGVIGMLLYSLISVRSLRRKVRVSMPLKGRIFLCDEMDSPFILGVIRPRIYLPTGLSEEERSCVLAHEETHLRRKDHWWKPIGFALLSVYWFNPLMWIAYVLLCRDIEMACDERVIKTMDKQEKKSYSEALLSCSVHRRTIMVCPLAFGEVGVKSRIKSVLNYKKPAFWVIAVALVASVAVGVCFLTNPESGTEEAPSNQPGSDSEPGYTEPEIPEPEALESTAQGELDEGESTTEAAEPQEIAYEAGVAWANSATDWALLYENSFCIVGLSPSSIYRIPVYRIDSKEQLEQFKLEIDEVLNIDMGWNDTPSFNEVATQYDKGYFAENTLLILYVWDGSTTPQYRITNVTKEGTKLNIDVLRVTQMAQDSMEAGWYLLLAVNREDVDGCNEFSFQMNETIKK